MRNGCIRRLDNLEPPSASDSSSMESIELDEMSLELSGAFWKCRTNTIPHERTRSVTTDLGQTISINLRMYKQIHTLSVVQGGGGGGWMEPHAGVFDMLQFFDKMRYILWVVGLLDACDVTNNGPILAAILDFTKNWKSG